MSADPSSSLHHRIFIVGGAGFIGSHFCDRLMSDPNTQKLTIYDNFSSGREWHFAHHLQDQRFAVVRADVGDLVTLAESMRGHDVVIHLASNPDIARAISEPTIDFQQGTVLTSNVVEAMRITGVGTILYASGSGVFGDAGEAIADENYTPMVPISTYGASKLAGEALIASYAFMFDIRGIAFRFGNVVGSRQTHGVGFDFVRRLKTDPSRLRILGDGSQTKPYIHVSDVVSGVLHALGHAYGRYNVFNLAPADTISVTQIAELACEVVQLKPGSVAFEFTGGDRGWKGDVPIVRLDSRRLQALGWRCSNTSREAVRLALESLLSEARQGLI